MKKTAFESQFGSAIADHWTKRYPEETEKLRKTGRLIWEADRQAFKAAEQLCGLLTEGVQAEAAYDAIALLWDKPPAAAERKPVEIETIQKRAG
jgi:hypothetical protein